MSIYGVVENDEIVNVVLWDGDNDWQPPDNSLAVLISDGASSLQNDMVAERSKGKADVTIGNLPDAALAVLPSGVGIGWSIQNGEPVAPPEPEEEEEV